MTPSAHRLPGQVLAYVSHGQSSEPLPFKAMTTYPPSLDQATDLDRVDEINADRLQRTQSFRKFWAR